MLVEKSDGSADLRTLYMTVEEKVELERMSISDSTSVPVTSCGMNRDMNWSSSH